MTTRLSNDVAGALICVPELLFDKKKIEKQIHKLFQKEGSESFRKEVSKLLSDANVVGRKHIEEALKEDPYASQKATYSYSFLTDALVSTAFFALTKYLHPNSKPTKNDKLSLLAVGGYGRAEMAPFSDVDLLFLVPNKPTKWSEAVVESMLYILWDMRLKIGHSTRNPMECIQLGKADQTIKTALMECRHLVGERQLSKNMIDKLWKDILKDSATAFVEEKLRERDLRHQRQGGQRYMVEPNVKEGKGGLRDLQSLFWITKYIGQAKSHQEMIDGGYFTQDEYDQFKIAHDFLWTTRCHLHLAAGRATEQLTFDLQVEVAKRLKYKGGKGMRAVERFMQDYFRQATMVGEITRVFLTALEEQHVKATPSLSDRFINFVLWRKPAPDQVEVNELFLIENGRLKVKDDRAFANDPVNILRLFEEGLRSGILLHQDSMRLVTANLDLIDEGVRNNEEARRIFMSLLLDYGNPERALRRMNELGVLGAFIPEFKRIIAMMQFNIYHHYTVDEHTIQCISVLAKIERGHLVEELPLVSKILKDGINRRILYVALLLHDIGKGLPEEHSIAGGRIAQEIGPQLGLTESEKETVVWLVENHLVMSDFAQKRDLSDPKTVSNFAAIVKSSSRLNLLTVLTVCDIMGVGPGTLNNWKAQLLRDLFSTTRYLIKEGLDTEGKRNPVSIARDKFAKSASDLTPAQIKAEQERHYEAYWQGLDTDAHLSFSKLLGQIDEDKIVSSFEVDEDRDATRAFFVMQDHPGIFSRIAGALALVNANVVDARTYTTSDGYATPVFWIQDSDGKPFEQARIKRLSTMINKTLSGDVIARDALKDRNKLKKRERDFKVPTEITFDNDGSDIYTIIEVDTRDRPSLLYDLTRTLSNANIQIASAVIATYGAQAVDVFYVKDMFGLKFYSDSKQKTIAEKLTKAIELGAEAAMA